MSEIDKHTKLSSTIFCFFYFYELGFEPVSSAEQTLNAGDLMPIDQTVVSKIYILRERGRSPPVLNYFAFGGDLSLSFST